MNNSLKAPRKKFLTTIIILAIAIIIIILIIGSNNLEIKSDEEQEIGENIAINNQNAVITNSTINNSTSNTIIRQQPSGITIEELAKHDNENDCWVGYDGK